MSALIPFDQLNFKNGSPEFRFDECYAGFENNDFLYRLVNTETKEWAFFNDSVGNVVKVKARFGPGSKIVGLKRTRLVKLPPAVDTRTGELSTDNPKGYEWEAFLEVGPGDTELFVQGEVNSYIMEFSSETAPAKNIVFEYRAPDVPYDKVYKCFKDQGNGLLFRLVDDKRNTWAFYNDTRDYVMKVSVDFPNKNEATPLNGTKISDVPSSSPHGVVYVLEIEPGQTEMFISGSPSSYKLGFAADPISSRGDSKIAYLNGNPDPAIIPNHSHVFRCFKEHSNGLLFRIVDDINKIWAFYNDTTDFVMTANARIPLTEAVQPAPGVVVTREEPLKGQKGQEAVLLTVQVAPLQTVPFFVGDPQGVEFTFAAAPAADPEAIENPHYENGEPDLKVIQPDVVYKCFKDHGNGLLFRLKDTLRRRWAFYNDTVDNIMTVRVSMTEVKNVRALGNTRVVEDPEMGEVYKLEVYPLKTELFIEGDVYSFTSRFSGVKIATPTHSS